MCVGALESLASCLFAGRFSHFLSSLHPQPSFHLSAFFQLYNFKSKYEESEAERQRMFAVERDLRAQRVTRLSPQARQVADRIEARSQPQFSQCSQIVRFYSITSGDSIERRGHGAGGGAYDPRDYAKRSE